MTDRELKFPEWQSPLQELILEFNKEKLPEQIQRVETLVSRRLQRLTHGNDSREERVALNDAMSLIRIIKRDKLGSSDQKQAAAS